MKKPQFQMRRLNKVQRLRMFSKKTTWAIEETAIEETFIECSVFQLTEIPYQIKSSNLSVNTIQ